LKFSLKIDCGPKELENAKFFWGLGPLKFSLKIDCGPKELENARFFWGLGPLDT
jgi:hypothetical protein